MGCGHGCAQRQGARGVRLYEGYQRALHLTQKDDLIFVYTRGGVVNADGEEKVPIAFFRAPSPVVSVSCAGDKIAVGCKSGAVLTLHAAWLTDGGAA